MSIYTGIQGSNILIVDTDPSNPVEGQIWYNTTSNTLKAYQYIATNAWATGGNLPSNRDEMGSAGTKTATLGFLGQDGPGFVTSNATLSYNGTSWSTLPATLNTTRRFSGSCGTQTSALAYGGYTYPPVVYQTASESYNGTSWTNTPSLNTARAGGASAGASNTSALYTAGDSPQIASTESYNGSSWTTLPASLPASKSNLMGFGIQTSAIAAGGWTGPTDLTSSASFNGSTWTSTPNLNSARGQGGSAGTSNTSGVIFDGRLSAPGASVSSTEIWNGTSYTSNPTSLSTARYQLAGAGTQTAALGFGGEPAGTATNKTESWTGPGVATTKTITTS